MQTALPRCHAAPPSTLPIHDDDEPPGPLLRRLDFPAGVRSAEPERLRRVPYADASVRPAAAPSTRWYGSGADSSDAYPQFQFRPAPFAPQSTALNASSLGVQSRAGRDVLVIDQGAPWHIRQSEMARSSFGMPFDVAAASLGRPPAVQRQTCYEFGKQQWPPRSDFDGWLRQADMDYCEQQALGGAGHAAGMPRQPQQEAVPDYEEQARAWPLLPEDNLAGCSYAAINAGPGNTGFYPPRQAALNSFHAGNYGAPPLRSTCAGEEKLRAPGDDDYNWTPGAHAWARDWQTAEHWNLSQASMCSDASTLHEYDGETENARS